MVLSATGPDTSGAIGLTQSAEFSIAVVSGGRTILDDESATAAAVNSLRALATGPVLRPLGNGQSDLARVQAAINSVSVTGDTLTLLGGTWTIDGTLIIPAGGRSNIVAAATAVFSAAVPGASAQNAMILGEVPNPANPLSVTNQTTLAAPGAVVGQPTLIVASGTGIAVGKWIQIVSFTQVQAYYRVDGWNPGTRTITTDRPVLRPYQTGDVVYVLAKAPPSMQFRGNGCTFTGSAVGWLYGSLINSEISDVQMSGLGGASIDYAMIWVLGAYGCVMRRIKVDATGAPGSFNCGLGHIGSEDTGIEDSIVLNGGAFASGIKYADAYSCWDSNNQATGCGVGMFFGSDIAATSQACVGNTSTGGHFDEGVDGIVITAGSSQNYIQFATANDNTTDGLQINGGGGVAANFANGNVITGGTIKRSGRFGVVTTDGSPGTVLSNLWIEASVNDDLKIGDDAYVSGLTIIGTSTTNGVRNIRVTGTNNGKAVVSGARLSITTAVGGNFSVVAEAGDASFSGVFMSLGTNCIAISSAGAAVTVSSTSIKPRGGAVGTIGLFATGGRITASEDCDLASTATPISRSGGAIGGMFQGTGAPNLDASIGSLYSRQNGGAGTSLYVNESGGAGGWVGK